MMKPRSMGSHHRPYRGATDVWLTPPGIIQALGPFDLDPASPAERPWDTASHHYTEADDGLAQPWDGFVWLNPPYGPDTWQWLDRLADHGNGIALVFARTETAGFFAHGWQRASSMLFLWGRLHFHRPDGSRAPANAGAPSVLLGYGPEADTRLRSCGLPGAYVEQFLVVPRGGE